MLLKPLLKVSLLTLSLLSAAAPFVRADYVVLRSGARLNVTGYEILGDHYRLHLKGGFAEVPVDDIVGIEPEEVFEPEPIQAPLSDKTPYERIIRAAAQRIAKNYAKLKAEASRQNNADTQALHDSLSNK